MSCLDIILPGSLNNSGNLPVAYDDQLISAGTLVLWEPAHPMNPFSGLPAAPAFASGQYADTPMPNIAKVSARNLLGNQSANVMPIFHRNDGSNAAAPNTSMLMERSALGGLHVITSQATMANSRQASLQLPATIQSYILANPTHSYYLSVWYSITRAALSSMSMPYAYIGSTSGVGSIICNEGITGHLGSAPMQASSTSPSKNTVGNTIEQWANTFQGTPPTSTTNLIATPFGFGQIASQYGDGARNVDFSAIMYRVFFEDLTVAGRTFAQVKAIDDALYAAAFAAGGRYYGDTFTNPSALP